MMMQGLTDKYGETNTGPYVNKQTTTKQKTSIRTVKRGEKISLPVKKSVGYN